MIKFRHLNNRNWFMISFCLVLITVAFLIQIITSPILRSPSFSFVFLKTEFSWMFRDTFSFIYISMTILSFIWIWYFYFKIRKERTLNRNWFAPPLFVLLFINFLTFFLGSWIAINYVTFLLNVVATLVIVQRIWKA